MSKISRRKRVLQQKQNELNEVQSKRDKWHYWTVDPDCKKLLSKVREIKPQYAKRIKDQLYNREQELLNEISTLRTRIKKQRKK